MNDRVKELRQEINISSGQAKKDAENRYRNTVNELIALYEAEIETFEHYKGMSEYEEMVMNAYFELTADNN